MNVDQLNVSLAKARIKMTELEFAHYANLVLSMRPHQFALSLARLRGVNETSKTRIDAIIRSFG